MARSRIIDDSQIDAQVETLNASLKEHQEHFAVVQQVPDTSGTHPVSDDSESEQQHTLQAMMDTYLDLSMNPDSREDTTERSDTYDSANTMHTVTNTQNAAYPNDPFYQDPICKACHIGVCQADEGFMVCPECGTVGEACIETGAEWRSFGGEDAKVTDPSRCGSATSNYLMADYAYSAGTQISSRWRCESDKMHLAQVLQRRLCANPQSRPLRNTFNDFKRTTYNNGYSHKIVDDALHLYTAAKKVKNFRADNRKGLMAKCLAETCKKHGVARSAKEICKDMGISVEIMTKGHRALTKARKNASETNHKINESSKTTRKSVDQPSDFVDRFCSRLKIPPDITEEVRRVTIQAKEMRLVSDNAPLVASACILLVAQHYQLKVSGSDIQKVVNISHVTIDKCFKKLRDFREALV
jgi:transcription initiation factor TFIIIB Brf1 subunit/transcription initiation factor TFIIB